MAYDPQAFLTIGRVDLPKRPPTERVADFKPIYLRPAAAAVAAQAARCMDCGVAFCHAGCPLGNLIPEWNELVAAEKPAEWASASERLHATNNFPEFTGWICPAPCEAACVLAINSEPVSIKQVELAIVERAFDDGELPPQPALTATGRKVAVVGSGPAGLAVAQQLTRSGHEVTVFERDDRIGGLLRYGIPDFKMPKDIIDRRLAQMRAEGTIFRVSTDVKADDVARLKANFDCVVLAIGALAPRELSTAGRALSGIHQAMEYLPWGNRASSGDVEVPKINAAGKHVVIIGGGDTAADCLGTANRQLAVSVTVLDHNTAPVKRAGMINPVWPAAPSTRGSSPAHDEGVQEAWAQEVIEFVGDEDGRLCAVAVEQVQVRLRPGGGREFVAIPESRTELPAELVLLAAGFVGTDSKTLVAELGAELVPAVGTVAVDSRWSTASEGVFACGDATRGASLVVWAIAEGRACAAAVDTFLMGATELPAPVSPGGRPL